MTSLPRSLNQPLHALRCLIQGLQWLARPELRHFVWMPLALNVVLYALGFWAIRHYMDAAMAYLLPEAWDWLRWLIWPLLAAVVLALTLFTFTLVANLLGAPFYGVLADKVTQLAGLSLPVIETPSERTGLPAQTWQSMAAEGRRLRYYGSRAIPLALLSLIPGLNLAAPLLWLILNSWFLALEYTAYPLERAGLDFDQQRRLLGQARWGALSFGLPLTFALAIPILNILVPPAAVVAAVFYLAPLASTRAVSADHAD